jgi:hypothetical protein
MADFWRLAGLDEALLVRTGGGVTGRDGLATLDVGYRSKLEGRWELLPNSFSTGIWDRTGRGASALVPLSVGWQVDLGLFSAPYVVANALATWAPRNGELQAGCEFGVGYEWRVTPRWAIAGDVRVTALWPVRDGSTMDDRSPYGARGAITLRRYLGVDAQPPTRLW